MEIKALIPIAHGTEEMEAVIITDILRRAGINVKVAGETEIITCSRGIKIIPDILIENIEKDILFDVIILPGGSVGTQNLLENDVLQEILENHRAANKLIGAICAAPLIIAAYNIVPPGTALTSHPSVAEQLGAYDYREDIIVDSGNVITSRGAGTAIPFALALIEKLIDRETAQRVAVEIVYE